MTHSKHSLIIRIFCFVCFATVVFTASCVRAEEGGNLDTSVGGGEETSSSSSSSSAAAAAAAAASEAARASSVQETDEDSRSFWGAGAAAGGGSVDLQVSQDDDEEEENKDGESYDGNNDSNAAPSSSAGGRGGEGEGSATGSTSHGSSTFTLPPRTDLESDNKTGVSGATTASTTSTTANVPPTTSQHLPFMGTTTPGTATTTNTDPTTTTGAPAGSRASGRSGGRTSGSSGSGTRSSGKSSKGSSGSGTSGSSKPGNAFHANLSKSIALHPPPVGFQISARVYLDPWDQLAHVDQDLEGLVLPYWDCGAATGSTTTGLPVGQAYFRHAAPFASTTQWIPSDSAPKAALMVTLSKVSLELNSGARLSLEPGQVVLLEDGLMPGHYMHPVPPDDLQVLFLTLPKVYPFIGKDHVSIPFEHYRKKDPCPTAAMQTDDGDAQKYYDSDGATASPGLSRPAARAIAATDGQQARRIRLFFLSVVSMSAFTLLADFLGKTAPLWLAVGVGGTAFVAAGTYLSTSLGDAAITQFQIWNQRRKLRALRSEREEDDEDESIVS